MITRCPISNIPRVVDIGIFKHAKNKLSLAAGEVLFLEGDTGDVMYAVVDGQLDLTVSGRLLDRVVEGGIVGEMALIDHAPRSATVTARTAAQVVPVDQTHFMFLVQEHPTFALLVMRVMAERIRHSNQHNTA